MSGRRATHTRLVWHNGRVGFIAGFATGVLILAMLIWAFEIAVPA